jgi:hypothetical protein
MDPKCVWECQGGKEKQGEIWGRKIVEVFLF